MKRRLAVLVASVVGGACVWWWWRLHPSDRPFAQRWWVDFPHPSVTRGRLFSALEPRPNERALDIGAGSGRFAVPVSACSGEGPLVAAVDLHPDMVTLTRRRAAGREAVRVVAVAADAVALPFRDGVFDAAWAVSVLGQVSDLTTALAEARRVVRPGGRVVVGELFYDPHGVFFRELCRHAAEAGLRVDARFGGWMGYVVRFVVPD